MADRESDRETIQGHVDLVISYCGCWPDDPPEPDKARDVADALGRGDTGYPDALAAWSYVSGWANAMDMTILELFDSLGVEVEGRT